MSGFSASPLKKSKSRKGFLSTLGVLYLQTVTLGEEAESRDTAETLNLLFLTVSIAIIIDPLTCGVSKIQLYREFTEGRKTET